LDARNDRPEILVGFDAGAPSRDALGLAEVLARPLEARIVVASVYRLELPRYEGSDDYQAALRERAEAGLAEATVGPGIELERIAVASTSDARGLQDLAAERAVALVVLGSTHRGPVGRVAPGSVAGKLLHGAPCPVAIAPRGFAGAAPHRIDRIGVASDGSPEATAAVRYAAVLASAARATVTVLGVSAPVVMRYFGSEAIYSYSALIDAREREVRRHLRRDSERLPDPVRGKSRLLAGDPAQQLAEATAGLDLLVMGSRGYGPVRAVLLGSVSTEVLNNAACPVIVVPRGVRNAPENGDGQRPFTDVPERASMEISS
jgi:nucleotide-binding universal stress UspA family protein